MRALRATDAAGVRGVGRPVLFGLALTLLLSGCGDAARDAQPPVDAGAPSAPDSSPPTPEVPLADTFRTLELVVPEYRAYRERGVGLVYPTAYLSAPSPRPDTIEIRSRPALDAPVAARLVRREDGVYQMQVRADVAESGGLEFAYEDIGLPLLGAPGTLRRSDWLRTFYGIGAAGDTLVGWVRNDTTRVSRLVWSSHLPEHPLWFLDPDSIQFHESVDGPPVNVRLTPSDSFERFDYILHSLETEGQWMRVEVVSPSDYCADPPRPVRDTVWIRYLDAGNRPRVWYYTRGC
jgi:hypothetical protein